MGRPTRVIINLSALRHNYAQIKRMAPNSSVLAMVKSNAYGHGIQTIGLALKEADALGVACIEEGIYLRRAGVQCPIVLMEGLFDANELEQAAQENFTLVVHHEQQVSMLEKQPSLHFAVWLKVDTGMNRLGFFPEEVHSIYQRLMACSSVMQPIGFISHFAQSEAIDREVTQKQIDIFNQCTLGLIGQRSLANSAGILAWPSAHYDCVRPGLVLYGASPVPGTCGADYQLQPVMSLVSQLIAIHLVAKGERIGYGGTWICPEEMLIGVVAIGYGDGYPQYAQAGTPVLVNGQICPLVGRVSMDMLTVDLRAQPKPKVGDPVILWGPALPVERVAENNRTSAYELLTRIAQRVLLQVVE